MDQDVSPTVRKLMSALTQFRKLDWHRYTTVRHTPSELRLLFCIKQGAMRGNQEMKVSEISRLLNVTPPTVTQLLKGLEANGLVERHTDLTDRRAVGITLTEKGTRVIMQASAELSATLGELTEYLGEEQSEQLAALLSKTFLFFQEKSTRAVRTSGSGNHVE